MGITIFFTKEWLLVQIKPGKYSVTQNDVHTVLKLCSLRAGNIGVAST